MAGAGYSRSMEALTRATLAGAGLFAASTAAGLVFEYLARNRIAARLGPAEYGRVYLVLAGAAILAKVAQAGSAMGVKRFAALHVAEGRPELAAAYIRAGLAVALLASAVIAAAVWAWSAPIARLLLGSSAEAPLVVIAAWVVPGLACLDVLQGALIGLKRTGAAVLASPLSEKALVLVFLAPLLSVAPSASGGLLAVGIATVLAAGIGFVLVGAGRRAAVPASSVARDLLSFSWPLQVASVLSLLMLRLDATMAGAFVSAREVGYLHAALPLAELSLVGFAAIVTVMTPSLMEYVARGDRDGMRAYYGRIQASALHVAGPAAALLIAFPGEVLTTLYSAEFLPAVPLLRALAVASLVTVACGPSGAALVALGRPRAHLAATIAGVAALGALDVALLPRIGIEAAGAARAGGFLAFHGLGLLLLRRHLGGTGTLARTARFAATVALATLAGSAAGRLVDGAMARLALGGLALAAVYVISVLSFAPSAAPQGIREVENVV
ncbi:MAG: oligosaccharide flippase family protein [Planctomycetota bacterium]